MADDKLNDILNSTSNLEDVIDELNARDDAITDMDRIGLDTSFIRGNPEEDELFGGYRFPAPDTLLNRFFGDISISGVPADLNDPYISFTPPNENGIGVDELVNSSTLTVNNDTYTALDVQPVTWNISDSDNWGSLQYINNTSTDVISINDPDNGIFTINMDGTVVGPGGREINLFEQQDRIERLEEQVKILLEMIPKKLSNQIIRSKNKID